MSSSLERSSAGVRLWMPYPDQQAFSPYEQAIQEKISAAEFLQRVRLLLPYPCKIWYPGCGEDGSLNEAFDENEIYCLDKEDGLLASLNPNFRLGRYEDITYYDDFFDAMYFSDPHMSLKRFKEVLEFLKYGALIIRKDRACDHEEFETDEMLKIGGLIELHFPYRDFSFSELRVFEKIGDKAA